ncbi:MAG: cation diffusion facilitator family transporter [Betaproteobacteria bacterium]
MHGHSHDHGHDNRKTLRRDDASRMGFSVWFTLAVFLAEVAGGVLTNSLALLSDAWHVLADVLALALSWWALRKAQKAATGHMTYGYHRYGVLAALANSLTLIAISGWIFYESYHRLLRPEAVKSLPMLAVAAVGFFANGIVALVLRASAHGNLNVRSAFLHVVGDAAASLGVIVGGAVMYYTGWYLVDPLIGAAIGLLILKGAWDVLRSALHILAERSPAGLDAHSVFEAVRTLPFVCDVHDVHLWCLSSEFPMLSLHVVTGPSCPTNSEMLETINRLLRERFGIVHSVIQLENECCGRAGILCRLGES